MIFPHEKVHDTSDRFIPLIGMQVILGNASTETKRSIRSYIQTLSDLSETNIAEINANPNLSELIKVEYNNISEHSKFVIVGKENTIFPTCTHKTKKEDLQNVVSKMKLNGGIYNLIPKVIFDICKSIPDTDTAIYLMACGIITALKEELLYVESDMVEFEILETKEFIPSPYLTFDTDGKFNGTSGNGDILIRNLNRLIYPLGTKSLILDLIKYYLVHDTSKSNKNYNEGYYEKLLAVL